MNNPEPVISGSVNRVWWPFMKMMRSVTVFVSVAVLVLFIASEAFADVVGKFTFVTGRVDLLQKGADSAVPVEVDAPVSIGDIVRTKSNSRAEITFLDDTVIRLAQSTRIEITDYLFDERGARKSGIVNLFRGKMRAIVSRPFKILPAALTGTPDFEVHTPNAVAGVRGTDFFSLYLQQISRFYVKQGMLGTFIKAFPDKVLFIKTRNCIMMAPGSPLQSTCLYVPYDWGTAPVKQEGAPPSAERGVFTYTPPTGGGTDAPPPTIALAGGSPGLPIIQPPPIYDPPEPPSGPAKSGDFERIYPDPEPPPSEPTPL
jgi:hypothetical protein